jgi:hypothetical protein
MAIFNNVPGLEAEVVVDGEPLHEYEDDDAEPDTMTKYIEALSDKEFALRFIFKMDTPVDHGVQVRMDIDGLVSCVVYSPDDLRKPWYKRGKTFLKNGQHFRQNYRFTALNIGKRLSRLEDETSLTLASGRGRWIYENRRHQEGPRFERQYLLGISLYYEHG